MKKCIFTIIVCLFLVNELLFHLLVEEALMPNWRWVITVILILLLLANWFMYFFDDNKKMQKFMLWLPVVILCVFFILFALIIPAASTKKANLVESGTQLYVNENYTEYILVTDQNELVFIYFESNSKKLESCVYLKAIDTTKGSTALGYCCHDYGYVGDQIYVKTELTPFSGKIYDPDDSSNEYSRLILHPETKIVPLEEFNCYDVDLKQLSYSRMEELMYKNCFFMLKDSETLKFEFCDSLGEAALTYNMETYSRVYDQELIERFSKNLWTWREMYSLPERKR